MKLRKTSLPRSFLHRKQIQFQKLLFVLVVVNLIASCNNVMLKNSRYGWSRMFSVSICVSKHVAMCFTFGLEAFRSVFGLCLVWCTTRASVFKLGKSSNNSIFNFWKVSTRWKTADGKNWFCLTDVKFEYIAEICFIVVRDLWYIHTKYWRWVGCVVALC